MYVFIFKYFFILHINDPRRAESATETNYCSSFKTCLYHIAVTFYIGLS